MVRYLYLFLSGIAGGILAGLGMGGGTLTIPLLVIALSVAQLTAQAVNLASFLPTGGVALILHVKNGLVETKDLAFLILPAIATCVVVSFVAVGVDGGALKRVYGGFLVAIGVGCFLEKTIQFAKIGYLH